MIKKLSYFLMAICCAPVLVSCSSENNLSPKDCVPKDANLAIIVNMSELDQKGYGPMTIARKAMPLQMSMIKGDLGVDTLSEILLFGNPTKDFKSGYMAGAFRLTNASKFKNLLSADGREFTTIEGTDIAYKSDKNLETFYVAVSGNTCLFLTLSEYSEGNPEENIKRLMTLPQEEMAYQQDSLFKAQLEAGYDASIWMNLAAVQKSMNVPSLDIAASIVDLEDTYIGVGIKFEKGRFVLESKFKANDKNAGFLDAILAEEKGLSDELMDVMPGDNLLGAGAYRFDPKAIETMVKEVKSLSNLEGMLKDIISIEDITGSLTGEIGITYNGLDVMTDSTGTSELEAMIGGELAEMGLDAEDFSDMLDQEKEIVHSASVTIGFKPTLKLKLLLKAQEALFGSENGEEGSWYIDSTSNIAAKYEKGYLQVVTSSQMREKIDAGSMAALPADARKTLSENSNYFSFDFEGLIMEGLKVNDLKDKLEEVQDFIPFTTATQTVAMEEGILTQRFTLELKNKEEYSIVVIEAFIQKLMGLMKPRTSYLQ